VWRVPTPAVDLPATLSTEELMNTGSDDDKSNPFNPDNARRRNSL